MAYLLGGVEESSGGIITKYLGVAGLPSAVRVGSTLSYLVSDGLGSVSEAFDTNGNETAAQLYAPYGTVRYAAGTMPTAKGFTGQRADVTTGLDYVGARYYDGQAGQFTSADSVSDGLSPYAYVAGNPETATDPTGHLYTVGPEEGGDAPTPTVPTNFGAPSSGPSGVYMCNATCGIIAHNLRSGSHGGQPNGQPNLLRERADADHAAGQYQGWIDVFQGTADRLQKVIDFLNCCVLSHAGDALAALLSGILVGLNEAIGLFSFFEGLYRIQENDWGAKDFTYENIELFNEGIYKLSFGITLASLGIAIAAPAISDLVGALVGSVGGPIGEALGLFVGAGFGLWVSEQFSVLAAAGAISTGIAYQAEGQEGDDLYSAG